MNQLEILHPLSTTSADCQNIEFRLDLDSFDTATIDYHHTIVSGQTDLLLSYKQQSTANMIKSITTVCDVT